MAVTDKVERYVHKIVACDPGVSY